MLILTRKIGEKLMIGDDVTVTQRILKERKGLFNLVARRESL